MTPSFQPYDQGRCLKALSVDNIKGFLDDLGHIVMWFLNINISSVTISFVVVKLMSSDQSGRGCAAFQQRTFDPGRITADQKSPAYVCQVQQIFSDAFRSCPYEQQLFCRNFEGPALLRSFILFNSKRALREKSSNVYLETSGHKRTELLKMKK